jgi:hypothetical protein
MCDMISAAFAFLASGPVRPGTPAFTSILSDVCTSYLFHLFIDKKAIKVRNDDDEWLVLLNSNQ